ncbi:MAG: M23 family metallopeptidase [Firmicutes bacterium]|nr:M23 family metallopeptidase [Bacillota bacterium]
MWRRVIRSRGFILLIFMIIFSFGILGQVDTRMHIGGSDWDLDSLIYINIDDFIVDETTVTNTVSLDGIMSAQPQPELPVEVGADLDVQVGVKQPVATSAPIQEANSKEEVVPPVAEPPKVEEKKEERPTIFVHKVHPGETLWDIANAYGITVDTILSANDLRDPNRISIGQELQILSVKGVLHSVATGESLWEIAERYKISMDEIAQANSISDPSRLQPNTKIVIPGATRLMPRDVLIVNGQLQKAFDWPTRGRISSPFGPRWGKMHNGLDIAVPTGTPIKAAADGRVTFAGWNGGYGILVIVDHGNGVETRYAHNSRVNVKVGQKVERGQIVSYSGNTGVSTGPHLHFEIRYRNNPVNPQTYLK